MNEDSRELITFLTNSYIDEPTAEKAQRLWKEVLGLEGWYMLLHVTLDAITPYAGTQDGVTVVAVWTDLDTLREYTETAGIALEGGELRFMFIPLPQVLEYVLSFEEKGFDGVRFNPPLGWAVPFTNLRRIAKAFGMDGGS